MDTRCPNCGACNSLDSLIGHTVAGKLLETTLQSLGELEKPMIQYLGLFRPTKTRLRLERANKIISDALPDILRGAVTRNRVDYAAPTAAWVYAIDEALKARDSGKLVTPLDGHGWLYTVISRWRPELSPLPVVSKTKTKRSLIAIEGMDDDQANHYIAKHLQLGESMQECFNRLIKAQGA